MDNSVSFLDNERNDAENTSFYTAAGDTSLNNISLSSDSRETVIEMNDNSPDSLLLAAGDGNRNPVKTPTKERAAQEFLDNEGSPQSELNTSGKRKREPSPDGPENDTLEGSEDTDCSGMESDNEETASDVDVLVSNKFSKGKEDSTGKELLSTDPDKLPDTVTVLKTPTANVYLVGTAHFSIESQEDVAKVIRSVQPNVLLIELCKARVNILQLDEKTILEEAKNINLEKIRSSIKQNGLFHGLMYILLLSMSAHLTKELGMAPGGEFRRAVTEAKRFPQCIIHLGDRPIHITLQRALSSLSWWQTIRLTWHLITSKGPISKEEVERCKQRDLLEEMLAEMTGEFPEMSTVFVKERDIYLTHSLQVAAALGHPTQGPPPPLRVVGVVGIGHVAGIVQNWGKVRPEDIPPLLHIPPPTLTSRVVRAGAKVSVVALVVWGCYRVLPVQKVLPSLSDVKASLQSVFQ